MSLSSFLFKQGSISSSLTILFLILSLLFVNLQIKILGIEQYGLIILLLSIFGTLNILNIGFGSAIVEYYTKFDDDKSVFWSLFISLFFAILFVAMLLTYISSFFYLNIFNLLSVGNNNLNLLAYIGFSFIGVSRLLGTVLSSYWIAKVNYLSLKSFGFINIYLSILIILILYKFEYDLNTCIFYAGISNLLFIITLTLKILFSSIRGTDINLFLNNKKYFYIFFKNALAFQGLSIINNISMPIINILINQNISLEAVTYLDIAMKFLRSGRQVIVSATEPFFGKITQLQSKRKFKASYLITLKYTRLMMILAILYFISYIVLSKIILELWLGDEIMLNTISLIYTISFGLSINIMSSVIYNQFLAIPKYRKYNFLHQLLQLMFAVIPFYIFSLSFEEYAYYLSFSYVISSIYLMFIFLQTRQKVHLQK